jgi:O-antigen/teichoic acid export membrane protein
MIKKLIKSSLVKTTGIYMIAEIINKAIPFFLLPLLTVYLTPTDYGIVSMFTVLLGFLVPFLGLNSHGAISRKYYDNIDNFSKYISTAFFLLLASSSIVLIMIIIFSDFISRIISFPEEYLLLVVAAGLGTCIIQIVLSLWRVREQALYYGIFQILQSALNVTLSLVLVMGLHYGWFGRVSGQVIAITTFAIIGFYIIFKRENFRFNFNREHSKDILKFGVPLIPHIIGASVITMSDRIFITNMVGINATGVYTVGFQIGMIIAVLLDSFNKAWTPYLFKNLKLNSLAVKRKLVKVIYLYFTIVLFITFIFAEIVSPLLINVFIGEAFKDSITYVVWISLGFAFNGMYKMVTGLIIYERKTHLTSIITFVTAIINLFLNYILIKLNGAVGASQATTLSFLISFILTWILSSRVHKMPWNIFKYRDTI